MTCLKLSKPACLLSLLLALSLPLATLQAQESGIDLSNNYNTTIASSLQSLNEISTMLDQIASDSEMESQELSRLLIQAQASLKQASQSLADSEAYRASLEQSLNQSADTLQTLSRRLWFWKISTGAMIAATVAVLIIK